MTDDYSSTNDYPSRHFYALVSIEAPDEDELANEGPSGIILFDAVAEDSRSTDIELLTFQCSYKDALRQAPELLEQNDQWVFVKVSLNPMADGLRGEVVTFGDSEETPPLAIQFITSLDDTYREYLPYRLLDLDLRGVPRANTALIQGILQMAFSSENEPFAVAVYDVGQGNCNALVDNYEHPRVFFDFGWPPNFHGNTRPPEMPNFSSCDEYIRAPVILSHWDMDHWAYAIASSRFNRSSLTTKYEWRDGALNRFWIASAADTLGPLAAHFVQALRRNEVLPGLSSLLLWPEGTQKISLPFGWIERCSPANGTSSDRNNNGLAMFIKRPKMRGAILLTGDADFGSIPSLRNPQPIPIRAVVGPHHGGRIDPAYLPKPASGAGAKLVLSVGENNHYGHPKKATIQAYNSAGWNVVMTRDRTICKIHGPEHNKGNQLLRLSLRDPVPKCGCNCAPDGWLCLA